VYPLKNYKSPFLEEESFGGDNLNQIGRKCMITSLGKGQLKPQERGIMIVYGILKYSAIFLQFYSCNDELVNKLKYAKNMHW
jgi:hypothetical protein